MAIKRLLEAVLIKVVPNETNRTSHNKEPIEAATCDDFVRFWSAPCSTATNHVNENNSNAPINVENEVRFLLCRELLHRKGVVQDRVVGKVLLSELLDDFNTLIGIGERLNTMSNAHDQLALLLHLSDEVFWCK